MQDIIGVKCKSCNKIFYPKRIRCSKCKGVEFEDLKLGNECRLLTYTKLYAILKGITKLPLVLGIVEFKNGAKVLGQIVTEEAQIGMKLRPVWGILREIRGEKISGFKFEPIQQ